MKRFLALLTVLLLLCAPVCAEEAPQPAVLSATGRAPVEADAQTAVLTFALCAEAVTADATKAAMETSRTALMALLNTHGVTEEDLHITRYDMAHVYDYHNTRISETKLLKGYKLDVWFETRLSDPRQARGIVDALFAQALDADYQLAFEQVSSQEAVETAVASAAQDAVRKMKLLCESMDLTPGRLLSMEERVEDGCALVTVVYEAE